MIELTDEFLEQLNNAAGAILGRSYDLSTAKGQANLQRFAYILTEYPENSRTIQVFNYIEASSSKKLEAGSEPKKVWHSGFTPKLDRDFHIKEEANFFRRGKSFPDPRTPELKI